MEIRGTSVLLTGGSRGIGPYIGAALVAGGARVTLTARSAGDLEQVRTKLDPDRVAVVPGDVSESADRTRVMEAAGDAFGPLDILVNNAGIESVLPFTEYTEDEIRRIVAVNLEAAIQLTRLVVPGMVERGRGHVVNISSLAGKAAVPYNTVYSATKHGLVGFTYSLREELHGSGVSASVICPGYVAEAGLFARYGRPEKLKGSGVLTTPRKVALAVLRAIEKDKPDVVVAGLLPQLSDVSFAVSPRLSGALARRLGGYGPMQRQAEKQARKRSGA